MKSQKQLFDLPLHSKTGTGNWLLFLGGAVFFSFLGYKVCAEAFGRQPFNLPVFLLGIVCILFALYSLLAPWSYYRIVIGNDCIVFTRFWGLSRQAVWRKDLVSYELLKKRAKYSSWEVLKLHTLSGDYSINSQMYANYFPLRLELTGGLPQTYHEERRAHAREARSGRVVIYLFSAIAVGGAAILGMRASSFKVDESKLVSYSCTLSGKPAIEITRHRGGHRPSLHLPVREHPGLNFNIYKPTFHAVYASDLVRNLDQGDTIFIRISRADYETDITKQRVAGFWEKYFGGAYKHIEIYELRSADNQSYLTLTNYERVAYRDRKFDFWLFVVLLAVLLGVYLWKGTED